jgi:3-methylcrotonyl-CoA carboxylase alpha subunit
MLAMFRKILVANRGEIAVRVIRAIRAVGAVPVAVYSDADRGALHVRLADEAYRIGPAPAADSYLDIEAVLATARESGAEAIHPGYGFLSENPDFAEAVTGSGLVFIGPPSGVIRLMGDKTAAKKLMSENGVPIIPGYLGEDQSGARLVAEAERLGYPLMIKAAAGGGGRGMRRVFGPGDLMEAAAGARREAERAFGDGRLFLERLLVAPRHIEVQVLADAYGNVIHLGERDCSIQRRHQKIMEEAPSTVLDAEARAELGSVAVRGAAAAGYVNAGTLEFLWSAGQFYFLEMNTRIQVEHPVTEMVTGVDLVKAQIEIAAGRSIGFDQESLSLTGHAIECRLYAEDPDHDFLPQAGRITRFEVPSGDSECRIDSGVFSGADVPRFYDPILAKIIAHGPDRGTAIRNLQWALAKVRVDGIKTNLAFLKGVSTDPAFLEDEITTAFLDDVAREGRDTATPEPDEGGEELAVAAAGIDLLGVEIEPPLGRGVTGSVVLQTKGWRVAGESLPLAYQIGGRDFHVCASRIPGGYWEVTVNNVNHGPVTFMGRQPGPNTENIPDLVVMIHRRVLRYQVAASGWPDIAFRLRRWDPMRPIEPRWGESTAVKSRTAVSHQALGISRAQPEFAVIRLPAFVPVQQRIDITGAQGGDVSGSLVAPMPGSVVKINTETGVRVQAHQALIVMEAMKMEHVLESPHAGTVRAIHFSEGDMVSAGATVVEVDPD